VLAEVGYMIETRLGSRVLGLFVEDLEAGAYQYECGAEDLPRIRVLVARYADLPLGLSDAAVIACAERSGGRVLTLDQRDFSVVARQARITLVP
jgi:predicted nucleic acid-binding protein